MEAKHILRLDEAYIAYPSPPRRPAPPPPVLRSTPTTLLARTASSTDYERGTPTLSQFFPDKENTPNSVERANENIDANQKSSMKSKVAYRSLILDCTPEAIIDQFTYDEFIQHKTAERSNAKRRKVTRRVCTTSLPNPPVLHPLSTNSLTSLTSDYVRSRSQSSLDREQITSLLSRARQIEHQCVVHRKQQLQQLREAAIAKEAARKRRVWAAIVIQKYVRGRIARRQFAELQAAVAKQRAEADRQRRFAERTEKANKILRRQTIAVSTITAPPLPPGPPVGIDRAPKSPSAAPAPTVTSATSAPPPPKRQKPPLKIPCGPPPTPTRRAAELLVAAFRGYQTRKLYRSAYISTLKRQLQDLDIEISQCLSASTQTADDAFVQRMRKQRQKLMATAYDIFFNTANVKRASILANKEQLLPTDRRISLAATHDGSQRYCAVDGTPPPAVALLAEPLKFFSEKPPNAPNGNGANTAADTEQPIGQSGDGEANSAKPRPYLKRRTKAVSPRKLDWTNVKSVVNTLITAKKDNRRHSLMPAAVASVTAAVGSSDEAPDAASVNGKIPTIANSGMGAKPPLVKNAGGSTKPHLSRRSLVPPKRVHGVAAAAAVPPQPQPLAHESKAQTATGSAVTNRRESTARRSVIKDLFHAAAQQSAHQTT